MPTPCTCDTVSSPAQAVLTLDGSNASGAAASISTTILCSFQEPCTKAVPVAADGAYPLLIQAGGSALHYTLLATAR